MRKNLFDIDQNFKKLFYILLFINSFFFLNIYDYPWIGDDYSLIFKPKLYNLLNKNFFIFDHNYLEGRFIPLYSIFYQILPANFTFYHLITVLTHFLSSLIIFQILRELNFERKICYLSSILYSIHYSIHAKTLIWIAFWGHTLNAFTGFISIFLFLVYLRTRKKKFLIFSILISTIGILVMESGAIYPIINFILIFFFRNKNPKILILTLFPLIIYFMLSLSANNSAYTFYLKRLDSNFKNIDIKLDEKKIYPISENTLYHYRSTYAPRDIKGYSFRAFDNFLMSLNLSSLENILQSNDKIDQIKLIVKKYLLLFTLIFFLFFSLLLYLVFKKLKILFSSKKLKIFLFLYIVVFVIYTIVFFRKDFSVGLSFCAVTIISFIYNHLEKNKNIYLSKIILVLFIFPSILFFLNNFNFLSEVEDKKNHQKVFLEYNENLKNKFNFNTGIYDKDFKYFYFYNNFKKEKNFLKILEGKSYREFEEIF